MNGKIQKRKKSAWILDIVHLVILLLLFFYTFRAVVCVDTGLFDGHFFQDLKTAFLKAGLNEIFTFIGAVAFVLFGIIGIYEFAYSNGLVFLVPPAFIEIKENKYEKQAEKMMAIYYEKDIEFIHEYEKERVGYILQAMGIEETQFHHIRYELVKARAMIVHNKKQLRNKAQKIIYDKRFIVDQSAIDLCNRVYKNVDYFINLYTALYDSKLCSDVSHIMANYIVMCMGKRVDNVDYIIVPQGSNLLLGLAVGKILRKPVIAIQEKERIFRNEFWDGNYQSKSEGKNNIIVIHDVLVTGKRIYESIEKLPEDTYIVKGVYCIIKYRNKKYSPEKELRVHNIYNINCLMQTDETILERVCKG